MLKDREILITGVTGKAVLPIAAALAGENEVWGQARFSREADREAVSALDAHVGYSRPPRKFRLINMRGEAIGVNSAIIAPRGAVTRQVVERMSGNGVPEAG